MHRFRPVAFVPMTLGLAWLSLHAQSSLSFQDRVKAQEAVERVFYARRVWPTVNPGTKLPFEKAMPREVLEERVRLALAESEALDKFWRRPLTGRQLQAEMDRMARDTKDPQVLKELFAALGNDPARIAECLARPVLADRLARSWYASDGRVHGELKAQVSVLQKTLTAANFEKADGGAFRRVKLRVGDGKLPPDPGLAESLSRQEFEEMVQGFPPGPGVIALDETPEAFVLKVTLSRSADAFEGATRTFRKTPFEEWLGNSFHSESFVACADPPSGAYQSAEIGISGSFKPDSWATYPYVPERRQDATAVWTGSEMIVWGGRINFAHYNSSGRYNPTLDSWKPTSVTDAPIGRSRHVAVWTGTEMIVWGGYDGQYTIFGNGSRYNPITDTWTAVSGTQAPTKRQEATAVWTGQRMIVWGGDDGDINLNTGAAYSPATDTWTPLPTENAPEGRSRHTAVWTGAEMIVWGGNCGSGPEASGGIYSLAGNSWSPMPTGGVTRGRALHTAVYTGREMMVWGGNGGGSDGDKFNLSTMTWTPITPDEDIAPAFRGCTAVWTGEEMIVWGGTDGDDVYNSGARYNPVSNAWTPTSSINPPSPRSYHVAVWTGNEMIVWGGAEANASVGGRYSPASDSWVPAAANTSLASGSVVFTDSEMLVMGRDYAAGRYVPGLDSWSNAQYMGAPNVGGNHCAVWTGTEMIVWGGSDGTSYPQTGGRFNPTTDEWNPTTTAGAPEGRNMPWAQAVWTGTEMIVWGGSNGSGYLNTGGRYNPGAGPGSDSWQPTSTEGACPSPRDYHVCAYAGSRMVIWGGYRPGTPPSYFNDGAQYDPANDTWAAMPPSPLSPRATIGSGVAYGDTVVIWGGDTGWEGPLAVFSDGARYYPDTGQWTSMAPPPPSISTGRSTMHGAWTGQEMIFWGGGSLQDGILIFPRGGGRYSFSRTDRSDLGIWTSTGSTGEPLGRCYHASVWTGNSMIVFGGKPEPSMAIYSPNTPPVSQPAGGTVVLGFGDKLHMGSTLPTAWWDDVEKPDPQPWSTTGWWHRVAGQYCSGAADYTSPLHAWYCGDPSTCTYTAGSPTVSELTLQGASTQAIGRDGLLTFNYMLDLFNSRTSREFPSADTPMVIPDPGLATSRIYVPVDLTILDVDVEVDITHPADGDLEIGLFNSRGTYMYLCTRWGGTGANFVHTVFDDSAAFWIGDDAHAAPPFTGHFRPDFPLAWLASYSTQGLWLLEVRDWEAGNAGTVDSWKLIFTVLTADGDTAKVECSTDGGITWTLVARDRSHCDASADVMSLSDSGKAWHSASIPVGRLLGIPAGPPAETRSVLVRFTLEQDGTNDSGMGWLLDDIGLGEPAGDGSNPSTAVTSSDGSSSLNLVPYHDLWDRATFEWQMRSDGVTQNTDTSTPVWDVTADELISIYGRENVIGDHEVTLKVTDSLGLAASQTATIHVQDGLGPTVSVTIPNGGESWDYSPGAAPELRKSHWIVWSASDNFGIARLQLTYSTDGVHWACIADTGEGCDHNGLTVDSTSFLWTMPTQEEAAAAGQTFPSASAKIQVAAWDFSNNPAWAFSASSFYIIQPTTTAVKTLILTDTLRVGTGGAVYNKLLELAGHSKVNGFVLDLINVPALYPKPPAPPESGLFWIWDLDPTNIAKANAVANSIRDYVKTQVTTVYTNANYLVLAGDDHVIPSLRVPDSTATYPEGLNYCSQVDLASPVGAAICGNYYLTDNAFGDLDYDTTTVGASFIALPDLATGRLVETPQEIIDAVNTFISHDGQVSLGPDNGKVYVTGYDFLEDSATSIRDLYQSVGKTVDSRLGVGWTADDLKIDLFTSPVHALHNLNDHGTHWEIGTPSGALDTGTMDTYIGRPLDGTLFYNVGCHSGLSIPDAWSSSYHSLDLPQLMLRKGVAAYVGNTGFGWGLLYGVGYSERLMELITTGILSQQSIALGVALNDAKRSYFLENHRYDVFDEKVLMESTLYGLPMYQVVVRSPSMTKESRELHADGPDEQEAGGIVLLKSTRRAVSSKDLPDGVDEVTMKFLFNPTSYRKVTVSKPGGAASCYYTLNGLCNGEIGDSLQPLFNFDSRLSNTVNRGVLFTGGHFTTESPFVPTVGVPMSSNPPLGEGPLPPGMKGTIGTVTRTTLPPGGSSRTEAGSLDLTRLTVYTGAYDSDGGGRESLFDRMDFLMYYSNSADHDEPVLTDPGPDPNALHTLSGLTANFSVQAADGAGSGVYRVVIAYTGHAGEAEGDWQSFDLARNSSSGKWEGNFQLTRGITYLAEAVDRSGNVGFLNLTGNDVVLDGDGHPVNTGSTYVAARTFTIALDDCDHDGMPDAWEAAHGLLKCDPGDAGLDPDQDGLTNLQEFDANTDPQNPDTDGDGDNDGSEVHHGRSPLDPGDGKRILIQLAKTGGVEISWPKSGAGSGDNAVIEGPYWVYRSLDPLFSVSEVLPGMPLATGTQTFTDTTASDPMYFYFVSNAPVTEAPVVASVVPGHGPATGGTNLDIYGQNFVSGANVKIGGTNALNVLWRSPNWITCIAPAGTSGPRDVTVTNPDAKSGTLVGGFTYD